MTDVQSEVLAIIASRVRGPAAEKETLALSDKLQDLGIESIDAIEMIFDLEEKFKIQIPYNANSAAAEFATVGDVVHAIEGLVGSKA
jgi:acyl carrier protein